MESSTILPEIALALLDRSETLSVAESCTGGLIGAACTDMSGSSQWFRGGAIVYQNDLKTALLSVSPETIDSVGVVSEDCVREMLYGSVKRFDSDWAIAVSGIAGPGGGTLEKPVGLVFIGVIGPDYLKVAKNVFMGDRESVRKQTVEKGLALLSEGLFSEKR